MEWLVAAAGVECQGPKQFAVVGDDAHVCPCAQHSDLAVAMSSSHRNVPELAVKVATDMIAGVAFFTCDGEQEQEANWFAGCLLLPRSLMVRLAVRRMSALDSAEKYEVTDSMAR